MHFRVAVMHCAFLLYMRVCELIYIIDIGKVAGEVALCTHLEGENSLLKDVYIDQNYDQLIYIVFEINNGGNSLKDKDDKFIEVIKMHVYK